MRSSTLHACQSPKVGHVPPGAGMVASVDSATTVDGALGDSTFAGGSEPQPEASSEQHIANSFPHLVAACFSLFAVRSISETYRLSAVPGIAGTLARNGLSN